MSQSILNPMEHKSLVNSSSEGFRFKKWEIQPYAGMEEMVIDYGSLVLHNELTVILNRMVSESLSEMKPPAERNGYEIVLASDAAILNQGSRRGRPSTSIPTKELAISFEIPNYCIANKIDMDRVALSYRNSSVPHDEKGKLICGPQFSFKERLEGWHIYCTQRSNNTRDMFYRHTKANLLFRSKVEVVRFMLYGIYPNAKKENKAIVPVDPHQGKHHVLVAEASSSKFSGKAMLIKPTFSDKEENNNAKEMSCEAMMVKNLLKDSCYTNLMNKALTHESEYLQGFESETVKDMMETLFNVLPNITTRDYTMMNSEDEGRRNGVKRARTENGGDLNEYLAASDKGKKKKEEEEDQGVLDDDDELMNAAEVLLNLKSATSDEMKDIPINMSLHQLAHLVLKVMSRQASCRCRCK